MNNRRIAAKLLPLMAFAVGSVCLAETPATEPGAVGTFDSSWESLKQYEVPEWFRDAKFGIWAHWGPQAVPMQGDWYARNMYLQGSSQYNEIFREHSVPLRQFRPVEFQVPQVECREHGPQTGCRGRMAAGGA